MAYQNKASVYSIRIANKKGVEFFGASQRDQSQCKYISANVMATISIGSDISATSGSSAAVGRPNHFDLSEHNEARTIVFAKPDCHILLTEIV